MQGLADDAPGAHDDHGRDDEREQRVYPILVSDEDAESAEDDGGGGEGVAEHVQEDAADVDVAGELPEQGGDEAVHDDAGGGDRHHEVGLDGDGSSEAVDGFDGDPYGERHERERVNESGENTGTLVAEGALVGGGARLEVDGDEAEGQGEEVGDVVAGFGDERERVSAEAEEERREDIEEREGERKLEDSLHGAAGLGVDVHSYIVVARRYEKRWVKQRRAGTLARFTWPSRVGGRLCRNRRILTVNSRNSLRRARYAGFGRKELRESFWGKERQH